MASDGCSATAAALSLLPKRLVLSRSFGSQKGSGAGEDECWEGEVEDDEDGDESGSPCCPSAHVAAAQVEAEPVALLPSARGVWRSCGNGGGRAVTS